MILAGSGGFRPNLRGATGIGRTGSDRRTNVWPTASAQKTPRDRLSLEEPDELLRGIELQCGSYCNWGTLNIRIFQKASLPEGQAGHYKSGTAAPEQNAAATEGGHPRCVGRLWKRKVRASSHPKRCKFPEMPKNEPVSLETRDEITPKNP
jgi:hypothetical protein